MDEDDPRPAGAVNPSQSIVALPERIPRASDYDLSPQQAKFCREYALGENKGNATKAALAAGYAKKSAPKTGASLINNNENVRRLILDIQTAVLAKRVLSIDDLRVILSDVIQDTDERLADRLKATDLYAKLQGWYPSGKENDKTGSGGRVIVVLNSDPQPKAKR